jgi:hypothetical protein
LARAMKSEEVNSNSVSGISVSAERHDHHNLEVKLTTEIGEAYPHIETDIFIYIPRSFEIKSQPLSLLMSDMRSRMRLALNTGSNKNWTEIQTSLESLIKDLRSLETRFPKIAGLPEAPAVLADHVQDSIRETASLLSDTLKTTSHRFGREFSLSQSISTSIELKRKGFEQFQFNIKAADECIQLFRGILLRSKKMTHDLAQVADEYISQIFLQFLHTVSEDFDKVVGREGEPTSLESVEIEETRRSLGFIRDRESKYRRDSLHIAHELETEVERERRFVRLSHLKKYFQSKNFVEVLKQVPMKKYQESTAFAATLTAGTLAAFVEQARGSFANAALSSIAIVGFGISVYVFRDRLKDWFRDKLTEKFKRMLPDVEQALVANGQTLGRIQEWHQFCDTSDVPENVKNARHSLIISPFEDKLPEDVLHCRKVQDLADSFQESTRAADSLRVLHENIRINIERHLKLMDDPTKELTELDGAGKFKQCLTHRVYHFHLIVRSIAKAGEIIAKETIQAYRVVLDKNGLVRIETDTTASAAMR